MARSLADARQSLCAVITYAAEYDKSQRDDWEQGERRDILCAF